MNDIHAPIALAFDSVSHGTRSIAIPERRGIDVKCAQIDISLAAMMNFIVDGVLDHTSPGISHCPKALSTTQNRAGGDLRKLLIQSLPSERPIGAVNQSLS